MNESERKARQRVPRWARTDRDRVMIVLGTMLIVFFVFAGYVTLNDREDGAWRRKRGPVKDPKMFGMTEHRRIASNEAYSARTVSRGVGAFGYFVKPVHAG